MKTRQQIIEEAILNELRTATQRYVAKSPARAAVSAIKGFVTGQGAREGVRQAALADYMSDAEKSMGRADRDAERGEEKAIDVATARERGMGRATDRITGVSNNWVRTPPTR